MGIESVDLYEIECDNCRARSHHDGDWCESMSEAMQMARDCDWTSHGESRDYLAKWYCHKPKCAAAGEALDQSIREGQATGKIPLPGQVGLFGQPVWAPSVGED